MRLIPGEAKFGAQAWKAALHLIWRNLNLRMFFKQFYFGSPKPREKLERDVERNREEEHEHGHEID